MTAHHPHAPALQGDDPSIAGIDLFAMAEAQAISRSLPNYVPSTLPLQLNWLDTFIGAALGSVTLFPAVFNSTGIFNIHRLRTARDVYSAVTTSREALVSHQRAMTAMALRLLYRREMDAIAAFPRPDPAMVVPSATTSPVSGMLHIAVAMAEKMKTEPNYKEDVHGRQFGLLPQAAPSPDPATLDPQPSAAFTGGAVVLTLRSPQRVPGVTMAEIYVDRNDGLGTHKIATTIHARFTDHHDLPAARTLWAYYVNYIDRDNIPVGVQSTATVVVQAMPTKTVNSEQ